MFFRPTVYLCACWLGKIGCRQHNFSWRLYQRSRYSTRQVWSWRCRICTHYKAVDTISWCQILSKGMAERKQEVCSEKKFECGQISNKIGLRTRKGCSIFGTEQQGMLYSEFLVFWKKCFQLLWMLLNSPWKCNRRLCLLVAFCTTSLEFQEELEIILNRWYVNAYFITKIILIPVFSGSKFYTRGGRTRLAIDFGRSCSRPRSNRSQRIPGQHSQRNVGAIPVCSGETSLTGEFVLNTIFTFHYCQRRFASWATISGSDSVKLQQKPPHSLYRSRDSTRQPSACQSYSHCNAQSKLRLLSHAQ